MSDQNYRILVCEPLGEEGLCILKGHAGFEVEVALGLTSEELKARIPQYHALLVRSQTQVNSDIITAGKNLRLIGRAGVGIDNIDIKCAASNGIAVINTPSGNSISTAEFAFALMLSLARHIPFAHQHVREHLWQRSKFLGRELSNKTLGLVGFGNVGRQVAVRAKAFGMRVLAFDPLLDASLFEEYGVTKQNKEELLRHSDFVSLHCGLNEHTSKFINEASIAQMKPGAMVVNTARGELVDTKALIEALDSGKLAAAALDVYVSEPPLASDPVLKHPRIITTPHLGASTEEAQKRVATLLAEQTIGFFSGSKNLTRVV